MPNWKKIITSGSDAAFNSLIVSNTITGSISGSLTGSLFGTASYVSGSVFTNTNPALSASYALTASYALNVNNSYTTNIAGGNSTQTITHNLGSRDVHVTVYRNSSPWDTILCDTQRTTTSSVDLIFAYVPTAAQFRVVVSK
jgi:hypothetical protein